MRPEDYQDRVVNEVGTYLNLLAEQQASANKHASLDAWDECKKHFTIVGNYHERKNGLGNDLPTFCVKVPTGGGKTLLATQILGLITNRSSRSQRGGAGALGRPERPDLQRHDQGITRNRHHFYRESLEHRVSRRIEVWEKQEIARLTPIQLATNLNILVLKLASTNRETKDQLRFFQDSGGNIVQHFPAEDDAGSTRFSRNECPTWI